MKNLLLKRLQFFVTFCLLFLLTDNVTAQGQWADRPGGATDIGVGANGSVWVQGSRKVILIK